MAKIKQGQKTEITLNTLLGLTENSIMARLNCHNIGKIVSFDPTTQTADIELMQIKQFKNRSIIPSLLVGVPLFMYGGENAYITLPNPTGSICILLFLDRNIDNFLETGEQYEPETGRMHDFSDCIALTTFKTLVNPIQEYDINAISILNNEVLENIQNNSFIKVYPQKIEISTKSTETSENETVTQSNLLIDNGKILLENNAGGQISVSNKINIQNTTQSLATLINTFLTACESITTVNGGALTASSKQLFTDLKTQFQELLQ